ncbi:hypothetical protein GCM10010222_41670 [Streptomyces tanashiensis]|nr:hypothetical protein GCM10010222_41670 [Streptomyces tanashiensis]
MTKFPSAGAGGRPHGCGRRLGEWGGDVGGRGAARVGAHHRAGPADYTEVLRRGEEVVADEAGRAGDAGGLAEFSEDDGEVAGGQGQ